MQHESNKKYTEWSVDEGKRTAESIYLNEIDNQIYVNRSPRDSKIFKEWTHLDVHFSLNSYGFRDKDFFEPADLLINGCSQTFGTALPEKYRFSNIIQENFSGIVHNIAYEGNSVGSVVRSTFAYIKKFGNPKYIYCMLPPFERIEFIPDPNTLVKSDWIKYYEKFKKEKTEEVDFSPIQIATVDPFTPIYAKSPYLIEDIMNPQTVLFLNMQMLMMLEQYCDFAGIKFMWSCWNNSYNSMSFLLDMQKDKSWHKNYFNIPVWEWEINKEKVDNLDTMGCHKDLEEESKIFFNYAIDMGKVEGFTAHWGAHRNKHVAEKVLSEMGNRSYEGII